jgi:5-phospho-D-xylono-1,4-lactonase
MDPETATAIVRARVVTVTGPVDPAALGVVDAHDHLFLDSPALPGQSIVDTDRVISEIEEARESGIRTIVEMTPIGLGRRPDRMRAVSEATGVLVVAASGYHRDAHYPADHWVHTASVELLADRILVDLRAGMHPADWLGPERQLDPARAGAIKGGASYHRISRSEARRLDAIGGASAATEAAVLVHAEIGTMGHEILDRLEAAGARPERIALAHMDRNPDADLHIELCARGVTLEYDTVGRTKYHPDSVVLDLIERVAAGGYLGRLMLGMDLGQRDYLRAYDGGPGLRYLMAAFVPRLRRRLGDVAADAVLVANPARFYAFPTGGAR